MLVGTKCIVKNTPLGIGFVVSKDVQQTHDDFQMKLTDISTVGIGFGISAITQRSCTDPQAQRWVNTHASDDQ